MDKKINKPCKMQNGIIGITRIDQTRDKLCVTWAERSRISQDTRYLFNLKDEEEETTFTRSDSLPFQMKRDADDVKKLITQLTRLDVFRVNIALREEEDGDMDSISGDIPLVSLASKDSAPTDVVSDLLRAEERGKLHVITNLKQRLIEKTLGFHDVLKKHRSKTFATLYKATVSTKHNVQKTVKADRKLLQRLLNAVTAGRTVEMGSILKHELSPVPLSLAKHGGDMNSTQKSELINVLVDGIPIPSAIPEANMKTCVMIDGHGLIQALGKPHGCQTFGDYADVFFNNVTSHFRCHTTRVDVVFDEMSHFHRYGATLLHLMRTRPTSPGS